MSFFVLSFNDFNENVNLEQLQNTINVEEEVFVKEEKFIRNKRIDCPLRGCLREGIPLGVYVQGLERRQVGSDRFRFHR